MYRRITIGHRHWGWKGEGMCWRVGEAVGRSMGGKEIYVVLFVILKQ